MLDKQTAKLRPNCSLQAMSQSLFTDHRLGGWSRRWKCFDCSQVLGTAQIQQHQ